MPPNDPPTQPPADASAHQTFYVVAGDMSIYDGDETVRCYQMVLASAQDAYEACDIARNALEDGLATNAAFDREELLAMVETLARHPFQPGESYKSRLLLNRCRDGRPARGCRPLLQGERQRLAMAADI